MTGRLPEHAVVAMYESRAGAVIAFNALRDAGLDMNRLTIDVQLGKFLVLAGGSAPVIGQACALLGATGPSRLAARTA